MKYALLALALISCCPSAPPTQAKPDRKLTGDDRTRFLVAAIFEGLHEDYPDPALFTSILKERDTHFVVKCPICCAVFDGTSSYLRFREVTFFPYQGTGFPKEIAAALKNEDRQVRLKAIEAMVNRYVARHYDRVILTPGEKTSMENLILMGRKYGMSVKAESFGDFCPSCAGATKK